MTEEILRRIIHNKLMNLKILSIRSYQELNNWYSCEKDSIAYQLPLIIDSNKEYTCIEKNIRINSYYLKPILYIVGDIDAILKINDQIYYGIDRWSKEVDLSSLNGNYKIQFLIRNRRVFGEKSKPIVIEKIFLVHVDPEIYSYTEKCLWLLELVQAIESMELRKELLGLLNESLKEIEIQVPSPEQIMIADSLGIIHYMSVLYDELLWYAKNKPEMLSKAGYGKIDYELLHEQIKQADKILEEKLGELLNKYPKNGVIHAVAHSHIDVAWLWSPKDTQHKVLRTIAKILSQLKRYPKAVYVLSSALYYEWLKENYPEIYKQVVEYVNRHRIIPVGGMWVESDTLIIPSESLVRQFLYGQKYFVREFGEKTWIGWLPDSFGYSANLPQILREASIKFFVIHKTEWNKYNRFPYYTFIWKGIDGTEIPTHVLINTYTQDCSAKSIINAWRKYSEKNILPRIIYAYGYGDGGGGPTDEMYRKLEYYGEKIPQIPRIVHGRLRDFYEEIFKKYNELPKWYGEIYIELHRGTYTTNTKIKYLVWFTDYILRVLEQIASLNMYIYNRSYPSELIECLWKKLLLSEFHDILPGTATREAYIDTEKILTEAIDLARRNIESMLLNLTGKPKGIIIYNPIQWRRKEIVEIDNTDEISCEQQSYNGKCLIEVDVPGLGYVVIPHKHNMVENEEFRIKVFKNDYWIVVENKFYILKIDEHGRITSIYDKLAKREVLSKPSNIITIHDDIPHAWDAWDIDEYSLEHGKVLEPTKISLLENGPLRAVIEIIYEYRNSLIKQYIRITRDSRRIDFDIEASFKDRRKLVKVWFEPLLNAYEAIYDTPYGIIHRPTHRNTSWEKAKFETPMLSWMSLEENNYGFAIISPVKHGITTYFNKIGLSLIKTPIYPDPLSDAETIRFTYSIYPYIGTWLLAGVHVEAKKVANPLIVLPNNSGEQPSELKSKRFIYISEDNIVLESIKKAEDNDSLILRLYEIGGKRGKVEIKFFKKVSTAWRCNILEEPVKELEIDKDRVVYDYRPYEIITLMIKFEE